MLKVLVLSRSSRTSCRQFQRLCSSTFRHRYFFSNENSQSLKGRAEANDQRLRRQKQVQYRKNLMQQLQLKKIKDQIQNTKQNFNPLTAYLKLYRSYFFVMFLAIGVCFVLLMFVYVGGVHRDVFTGRKKFVLISDKYQKSIDQVIRKIIFKQLCGTDYPVQNLSLGLRERVEQIQEKLCSMTDRRYRIYTISTAQHVLVVLPESIIISKNMWLQSNEQDVFNLLLLMQGLFIKRWHIKELALSNFRLFGQAKFMQSSVGDIKFSSIYSRRYNQEQIELVVNEMSKQYQINTEHLKQRVYRALNSYKDQYYKQESQFSLVKRFQGVNCQGD